MKPMDAALVPPGVRHVPVTSWRAEQALTQSDWVAEEVPVALVLNGISHAVMMVSPDNLEEFALGFGLTEGLLDRASQLYGVEAHRTRKGIELHLEVAAACAWRLKDRRRSLAGRTGCGLCGTDSLDHVKRSLPIAPHVTLSGGAVGRAQRELRVSQAVQQLTGATHAAAWCAPDGRVLLVREDVGRHNALDKLVGAMVRAGIRGDTGFISITSRASFEMVQKTAMAGVGVLAAVSAPTALAVETALQCGVALAGFVRGDDLVAYTFPERFGLESGTTA